MKVTTDKKTKQKNALRFKNLPLNDKLLSSYVRFLEKLNDTYYIFRKSELCDLFESHVQSNFGLKIMPNELFQIVFREICDSVKYCKIFVLESRIKTINRVSRNNPSINIETFFFYLRRHKKFFFNLSEQFFSVQDTKLIYKYLFENYKNININMHLNNLNNLDKVDCSVSDNKIDTLKKLSDDIHLNFKKYFSNNKKIENRDILNNFFSLVNTFPLLSRSEEYYLFTIYRNGDYRAGQILFATNLRLVISLSKRFIMRGILFNSIPISY